MRKPVGSGVASAFGYLGRDGMGAGADISAKLGRGSAIYFDGRYGRTWRGKRDYAVTGGLRFEWW